MELSPHLMPMLAMLAGSSPALVLWITIIVFAAVRRRRGGGRAERFLLAGGIIGLAGSLLSIPQLALAPWLLIDNYGTEHAEDILFGIGLFLKLVNAAGTICLIYAFWVKFKERNNGAAATAP